MKLICTERDYADEFDYPIISVITNEFEVMIRGRMKELKKFGVSFTDDQREYYFDTNEIIDMIDNAKPITDAELEVLAKFGVTSLGIDIVSRVMDSEEFDEEDDD